MKFSNRPEAEAAKELLSQEGIRAFVWADDQGGMLPTLTLDQGVELKVADEDFERAKETLGFARHLSIVPAIVPDQEND